MMSLDWPLCSGDWAPHPGHSIYTIPSLPLQGNMCVSLKLFGFIMILYVTLSSHRPHVVIDDSKWSASDASNLLTPISIQI